MKYDNGKPQIALIPAEAILEVAKVLTFGATKYGPNDWRHDGDKTEWSRTYSSIQRHLNAFWSGEDNDPETGLSHLAHATTQLMILMTHQIDGNSNMDDRFKSENKDKGPYINLSDIDEEIADEYLSSYVEEFEYEPYLSDVDYEAEADYPLDCNNCNCFFSCAAEDELPSPESVTQTIRNAFSNIEKSREERAAILREKLNDNRTYSFGGETITFDLSDIARSHINKIERNRLK